MRPWPGWWHPRSDLAGTTPTRSVPARPTELPAKSFLDRGFSLAGHSIHDAHRRRRGGLSGGNRREVAECSKKRKQFAPRPVRQYKPYPSKARCRKGATLRPEDLFEQTADLEWQDDAACNAYDNVLFFGEEGESEIDKQAREGHAKSICQRCPVREPCLEFAMETNQKYGIWGGMNDKERASLKRRRARARRAS